MSTPEVVDATEEIIGALKQYFSVPIARAIVTSTVRRAKLDDGPLSPQALPELVAALEQALPMYLADASRRSECVARLRRLTQGGSPSPVPPPASPPPAAFAAPAPISAAPIAPVAAASNAPAAARIIARGAPAAPPSRSSASTVIQITTAEDVANACEVGRDIACRVGFPSVVQTKIATAIAELARNILLYSISGAVRVAALDSPRKGVEVAANDSGPGIPNLDLVMSTNYRSRTGMGMGLKGAKRLMDTFEIDSSPKGTNVLIRKFVS